MTKTDLRRRLLERPSLFVRLLEFSRASDALRELIERDLAMSKIQEAAKMVADRKKALDERAQRLIDKMPAFDSRADAAFEKHEGFLATAESDFDAMDEMLRDMEGGNNPPREGSELTSGQSFPDGK